MTALLALAFLSLAADVEQAEVATVAVVPVEVFGLPAEQGTELHRALEREIEGSAQAQLAAAGAVDRALAQTSVDFSKCHADDYCLATVGRAAGADLVLAVSLAGLGSTRLIRCRLLRVDESLVLQDLQETVVDEQAALDGHATQLVQRLFPEASASWYAHWWVWTAAGVGTAIAVTAVVVTAVLLSQPDPGVVHVGDL